MWISLSAAHIFAITCPVVTTSNFISLVKMASKHWYGYFRFIKYYSTFVRVVIKVVVSPCSNMMLASSSDICEDVLQTIFYPLYQRFEEATVVVLRMTWILILKRALNLGCKTSKTGLKDLEDTSAERRVGYRFSVFNASLRYICARWGCNVLSLHSKQIDMSLHVENYACHKNYDSTSLYGESGAKLSGALENPCSYMT